MYLYLLVSVPNSLSKQLSSYCLLQLSHLQNSPLKTALERRLYAILTPPQPPSFLITK